MAAASSAADASACPPVRIAIVGAGLGGLTLARMLHVSCAGHVVATVYESDASEVSRDQGGTLDMHEKSGQAALRAMGLWSAIAPHLRPEGEAMILCGADGIPVWEEREGKFIVGGPGPEGWAKPPADPDAPDTPATDSATPGGADPGADAAATPAAGRPEVDRGVLRKVLLDSLPAGSVRWGAKVMAISAPASDSSSVRTLTLSSGERIDADLVVGADGAWSKVRSLVSSALPAYTGITFVECQLAQIDQRHPELAALVGPGLLIALAPDKGIFAQRVGTGSVRVYAAMRVPADWAASSGLDWTQPSSVRAHLLAQFAGFAPPLRALLSSCDDLPRPVARPLFGLPVDHSWPRDHSTRGVTLVGDAAHLMPPSGEGANLAMQDGMELALALAAHPADIDAALRVYESTLFPRSHESAADAQLMMDNTYAANTPQSFIDAVFAPHFAATHAKQAADEQAAAAEGKKAQ